MGGAAADANGMRAAQARRAEGHGSHRSLACSRHRRQRPAGLEPVLCRGGPRPARSRLVARRHRHRGIQLVGGLDPVGTDPAAPQGGDPLHPLKSLGPKLAFLLSAVAAAIVPLMDKAGGSASTSTRFGGWPTHYEGLALTELPLTQREVAFTRDFPGRVGRFTDGRREIIVRWVNAPT